MPPERHRAAASIFIERIQETKKTEAFEVRAREEQARLVREQQAARDKIQVEEQTTILQRESQRTLAEQRARLEQQARLTELARK